MPDQLTTPTPAESSPANTYNTGAVSSHEKLPVLPATTSGHEQFLPIAALALGGELRVDTLEPTSLSFENIRDEDPQSIINSTAYLLDAEYMGRVVFNSTVVNPATASATGPEETTALHNPFQTKSTQESAATDSREKSVEFMTEELISRLRSVTELPPIPGTSRKNTLNKLIQAAASKQLAILFESSYESLWQSASLLQSVSRKVSVNVKQATVEYRPSTKSEKELRINLFEKFGLNPKEADDIYNAWQTWESPPGLSTPKEGQRRQSIFLRNFAAMQRLYDHDKNAVSCLHREFGIRHFGRYHTRQMKAQLDGNFGKPISVALAGIDDSNNALANIANEIDDIAGEGAVIIEGSSLPEIARRLVRISRKFGTINGTLLVMSHGSQEGIAFAETYDGILDSEDVQQSKGMQRLVTRNIFGPSLEIVLDSCETGTKGGVGEEFAKATGLPITAPDFVSHLPKRDETGKVVFGKDPEGTKYGARHF